MAVIKCDHRSRLYVITYSSGTSCLGFDNAFNKALALAQELHQPDLEPREANRGKPEGYAEYERVLEVAKRKAELEGWRSEVELHPQLRGLEGKKVQVTDESGKRRRFIVGRSTGFVPCHLEIKSRRSRGGEAISTSEYFRFVTLVR